MAGKLSQVAEAYERSKIARAALREAGARSMEVTVDKCGIVWERFIIGPGTSVILFATPSWWEVFTPLTSDITNDGTIARIKELARA